MEKYSLLTEGLFIWARLTGLARLPGWILPWVHMRNFSPVSEMRKGQRVLAPNLGNKANIAKHKNFNFRAYLSIGNSQSCITAVKWDAYDLENTAGNARRCHPDRHNSLRFHPGNRDEVFIWQNFQPAYRDLGWKNRDLGNQASPPSHMNTSKIFQRI